MPQHVIIDGNNLLYAMHAHAPIPLVGRETMVKVVERWARRGEDVVTLLFDGPRPFGGLSRQLASKRITVEFSAPKTADDVIVGMIERARDPAKVRVVTGDTAIRHEAKRRRCICTDSVKFVAELFSTTPVAPPQSANVDEKPSGVAPGEVDDWLRVFEDIPDMEDDVDRMMDELDDQDPSRPEWRPE